MDQFTPFLLGGCSLDEVEALGKEADDELVAFKLQER